MNVYQKFIRVLITYIVLSCIITHEAYSQREVNNQLEPKIIVKDLQLSSNLRQSICLNGIWDFKSNVDSVWQKIPVPGSYTGIRKTWGKMVWDCWDYPERWQDRGAHYKKEFELPKSMEGKNITIRYEGIAHHAKLFFNDNFIGESYDAYVPFEFDVTKFVKTGKNKISIEITDEPSLLFSDYKEHLYGIWRDISLNAYNNLYVGDDAFVTTSVDKNMISIETPIINKNNIKRKVFIRHFVSNLEENIELAFDGGWHTVSKDDTLCIKTNTEWENARLWFPHDPYLYHIHTIIYDEKMKELDHHKIRFGFREISWDGPHLYINGRELFLHGHGGHSQGDLQGSREYYEAWLGGLKKIGINFMRLHNDPKHAQLYEVADEIGMMLEAEPAFHFQVPKDTLFALEHISKLVKSQRNHPSIIMWSTSNELRWNGGGEKKYLIDRVQSLDDSRPVFASDFSLESRYGDLIAHHYNPKTVFEEWEKYGPSKPMIWDELGSVWQHDRPLSNGTAGFEVSSQDYATGLWRDGYEQMLVDIEGAIDGKMINGKLHRPSALVPWDFSYNFFRFHPVNKNRVLELDYQDFNSPGIKIAKIKPAASTINIWDPTLLEMEPNPGYYLFAKHLPQVRFFDTEEIASVFSGEIVNLRSKLYYEDLRLVDSVACIVEGLDGIVYSKNTIPLDIKPGQIRDGLSFDFFIPELLIPTSVKLVRELQYKNQPGYRHSIDVTIFPAIGTTEMNFLESFKIGVFDHKNILIPILRKFGVKFTEISNWEKIQYPKTELLLSTTRPEFSKQVENYLEEGGRWVVFSEETETNNEFVKMNSLVETFDGNTGPITSDSPFYSANTGFTWFANKVSNNDKISITENTSVSQYNKLTFNSYSKKPMFAYTEFKIKDSLSYLSNLNLGKMNLRYRSEITGTLTDKYISMQVLLKDANNQWFISCIDDKIQLKEESGGFETPQGNIDVNLVDMNWEAVNIDEFSEIVENLNLKVHPDFSKVFGVGIYLYPEDSSEFTLSIQQIVCNGFNNPSARIPLNGAKHKLLKDISQSHLTFWRNGSNHLLIEPPYGQFNCRNILTGDKDGNHSSLFETFIGKGLCVASSLNILQNIEEEPAASQMLINILHYVTQIKSTRKTGKTLLWTRENTKTVFDEINLLTTDGVNLSDCKTLIIDARDSITINKVFKHIYDIREFVKNGGKVWIQQITESSLPVFRYLVSDKLKLTDPFRLQRTHCVKAATSWTLNHTPKTLVEYYDGILIPQPFEPNFDPLLTGITNLDLSWDNKMMFNRGVEIEGMDPTNPLQKASILVSNWGIDWAQPDLFGEYIHEARDWQRATWFVNRDPVVLKVKHGLGDFLICQLDFSKGGEKGKRILSQLLNGLHCSIGVPTSFPAEKQVFDLSERIDQINRFEKTNFLLDPVQRVYYGASSELNGTIFPTRSVNKSSLPTVLILSDSLIGGCSKHVHETLAYQYNVEWENQLNYTSTKLLDNLDKLIGDKEWNTIQISVGMEDIRLINGQNTVNIEDFKQNLSKIILHLKETKAKLYWTTIVPAPELNDNYRDEDVLRYNKAALEIMNDNGVYTNDLYDYTIKHFPKFIEGVELDFSSEMKISIGKQIAEGIKHFGAAF